MNARYFDFDKNNMIWLYGAAATGVITERCMEEQGFTTEGFIDKRADEIKILNGKKVLNLEQFVETTRNKSVVVIVTVKNVFEHERIAMDLVKEGINNIIYFPYNTLKGGGSEEEKILYVISDIISKRKKINEMRIPKTFSFCTVKLNDALKVSDSKNKVKVFLPFCMVYTDKKYKTAKLIKGDKDTTYLDKNIAMLNPHIQFFEYLLGDVEADYNLYLECCEASAKRLSAFATTERWKENVFRNRMEVFENMNREYEMKSSFFIESAPDVEWNNNGYFNLISGKHRAAFLMAKRDWYIPVTINKNEYNYLFRDEDVSQIKNLIREKNVYNISVPVEHPLFADVPCYTNTFWYGTLQKICFYMSKNNWVLNKEQKIIIDIRDFGFFSRFFKKMGLEVIKTIKSVIDVDLENAIKKLLCCENYEYVKDYTGSDYDYIITSEFPLCNKSSNAKAIYFLEQKIQSDCLTLINVGMSFKKPVFVYMENKNVVRK